MQRVAARAGFATTTCFCSLTSLEAQSEHQRRRPSSPGPRRRQLPLVPVRDFAAVIGKGRPQHGGWAGGPAGQRPPPGGREAWTWHRPWQTPGDLQSAKARP